MAVLSFKRDLAIGERVEDVLRDFRLAQIGEEATAGAAVEIYATGGGQDVLSDIFIGPRQELERSELSEKSTSPIKPEDTLLESSPARPLERIRMSADNQSGSVRTIRVRLVITEL